MPDIATLPEFASFLQTDVDTATANLLLLDLAQGLITEEIGAHDPWPKVAKSITLASAGRAYRNPNNHRRLTAVGAVVAEFNPEEMGVYLTDSEVARLHRWLNSEGGGTAGQPQGSFPGARDWPDPLEAPV